MTLKDVTVHVHRVDPGSPVVSYQAADPANARLLVNNMFYVCPVSHWPEILNTTAYGSSDRLETLQVRLVEEEHDRYSHEDWPRTRASSIESDNVERFSFYSLEDNRGHPQMAQPLW